MNKHLFSVLIAVMAFQGCKKADKDCRIPAEYLDSEISVSIERLEIPFFENLDLERVVELLETYPEFADQYLMMGDFESKEELAGEIVTIHQNEGMQELYEEVKNHFDEITKIEQDLQLAFQAIHFHYPDFVPPKVYTYVSGFSSDLFITEDIIVIGLDYFLPPDHRFQPPEIPVYIAKRYEENHLVPTLITALSSKYNQTDLKDNSLLAEMIFYGKSYHFTKTMMPCTPDEYIIGYSSSEITASYANEEMIWAHFIENELLFETNPFEIRKYTGEAPFTDEISPDAPGRLGRWIGWNIVDDYREQNAMSLPELMSQPSAREIFRQSGYRPR
ncbi:gliding motility lipoprotein GldB [Pleomorphovibrio marinus]|uniref:gliding motility lipoprotein GldB n=1 Tax=Pleomorphovibrio marinus TaxID=2164132 RepID=UPI000E0C9EDD|nr:gliding motility lipoprotein GldB [Pleomorphovibrio marinus]